MGKQKYLRMTGDERLTLKEAEAMAELIESGEASYDGLASYYGEEGHHSERVLDAAKSGILKLYRAINAARGKI